MSEKKDFNQMLNELNSNLNLQSSVNSVYQKKYDYESLNIAKNLQKSFRTSFRKESEKVYYTNVSLDVIKNWIEKVEKSLLVCTKNKKKFYQLTANDIFNGYSKLSEKDKNIVDEKHKLFVEFNKPETTKKSK